ncbi:MAG: cation diffusion facilitator family transporter [Eubacteriales bacterium]|nr:cation diffusion facilitator family transporter [Eubacteriales bacterium]
MIKLLIRIFIKDYENTKDPKVRDSYGRLASVVGIISNLLLSGLKITLGLIFHSIAILADGINNIADTSSSIILLIGLKLAAKPADEDHPYGHARIEYITGLLISFLIIILGLQLLMTSIKKIISPNPIEFSYITVVALIIAIGIKIWQSLFYLKIGEIINSVPIKANCTDSRNDVIATTAVLSSILISKISGLQLDGYMGGLVALFIIYSGIQLIGETSTPLLGGIPDPELVAEIRKRILSYKGVVGIHDLVVHSYGARRTFATVHIEVDAYGDLIASHDMVDIIERTISRDLKIELVAHMDPLETSDPLTAEINRKVEKLIAPIEGVIGHHDLRIVAGYTNQKIVFDLVVDQVCTMKESELKKRLDQGIKELSPNYFTVITIDRCYKKS